MPANNRSTEKTSICEHPSYTYARSVVDGEVNAPKYVIKQARQFVRIADGRDATYCINIATVRTIDELLKIFIMPKGVRRGETIYTSTIGYQWLFYIAVLCTVYREDTSCRRYQTAVLEIARKNFKTFTIAVIFLLLFFTEPKFSKFFSVAPDGVLSKEVQSAISEIISATPALRGDAERGYTAKFKPTRDYILCISTQNKFTPLACSINRMDGREPSVFLADEVGALRTSYPIEAMRSGQILLKNKLGCIISTKYPTIDNPFEEEVKLSKAVLDRPDGDESRFSLLYEPDNTKDWMTDDGILEQANPAAIELPAIMEDLKRRRQEAIDSPPKRENFVTKHCNIIYQGEGTESYIDINAVRACAIDNVDFSGMTVYVGVDLSMSGDNTAVAIAGYKSERDRVVMLTMGFYPAGRQDEKTASERFDYYESEKRGECIACGNMTVDYPTIEAWVDEIQDKFSCTVGGIAFDRYNCTSSAQKWEKLGYQTVEVRQHSSVLHAPTKRLCELFLDGRCEYRQSLLFEVNMQNAKCTYDTNMNRYVNKKRSAGKVDQVVALINAMYLVEENEFLDAAEDWGADW